jgi:quercetin dioxygenase-like cupin family protein
MTEKYNDATRNRPEGERIIDADTVLIDMPAFIRQIKSEDAWLKSDRNSITVFKTGTLRMVLGGLHEGAEFPAHKAEGIMCMQVLEGLLEANTDGLEAILKKGQMVAIHKGCNYRFVALEETIYLLTLNP